MYISGCMHLYEDYASFLLRCEFASLIRSFIQMYDGLAVDETDIYYMMTDNHSYVALHNCLTKLGLTQAFLHANSYIPWSPTTRIKYFFLHFFIWNTFAYRYVYEELDSQVQLT